MLRNEDIIVMYSIQIMSFSYDIINLTSEMVYITVIEPISYRLQVKNVIIALVYIPKYE